MPFWFIALDTIRLRHSLTTERIPAATRALRSAAALTETHLVAWCMPPFGVRCVCKAAEKGAARIFVRRFTALCAADLAPTISWRGTARVARLDKRELLECLTFLQRCRRTFSEVCVKTARPALSERRRVQNMLRALRVIEDANAMAAGSDAVATFVRHYVAEHDAPADDGAAYRRLCHVILAQGLGFAAATGPRHALESALADLVPEAVARFDGGDIDRLLAMPIFRNRAKLEACVENAKRWCAAAASNGSYMACVAALAAQDDAADGWPKLVGLLQRQFLRTGDAGARHVLKRWGFFTALAHPAAQRVLARLGMLGAKEDGRLAQRFICKMAQTAGRDPYAIEAALLAFATAGPCRKEPRCASCALSDRCPTAAGTVQRKEDRP